MVKQSINHTKPLMIAGQFHGCACLVYTPNGPLQNVPPVARRTKAASRRVLFSAGGRLHYASIDQLIQLSRKGHGKAKSGRSEGLPNHSKGDPGAARMQVEVYVETEDAVFLASITLLLHTL
jgi:hypothetical protein